MKDGESFTAMLNLFLFGFQKNSNMKEISLNRKTLGINFSPGHEPVAVVWAPMAKNITLKVQGKQDVSLHKKPYGYWEAVCPQLMPGDRYAFMINGKDTWPDPASLAQPEGVHEYSECIDLNEIRKIRDESWQGISMEDLIIYELHVGTFTPEGTFKGVEQKLDYLKELGVNALKILPVAAFPGSRNWGYDGVFPFAVQQSYGGAMEFARLVKACHQKGIAVILDVVYNHLGPEGNYLGAFGPYFTGKYKTPWGRAINFDDAWCDGVRHYFLENAMMWFRDFHIDGLRLDAVHAIKDFSPKHFLQELSEHVHKLNQQNNANHFLIAECDLNDVKYINPLDKGGYGLDAQWCDEWHHSLHALMTGERQGYYDDFGELQQMVRAFNDAWVYDGIYSPQRKKKFGTSTKGQPGQRFVIFTQNHDQVGNRMLGDRLSTVLDFESLKLAAGAMLVSPFVPMIFMGEEYAETSPFLYFISHGDKELVEMVRKGRKREFRDFMKNADPPDPAAEETFQKSTLKWDYQQDQHKQLMLAYYSKLIALRRKQPLIKTGSRENVKAFQVGTTQVIALTMENGDEKLLALMNFEENAFSLAIPEPKFSHPEILIYSAHKQWGGPADDQGSVSVVSLTDKLLQINAEGRSFLLLKLL